MISELSPWATGCSRSCGNPVGGTIIYSCVDLVLGVGILPHYATQAAGGQQRVCAGVFDKGVDLWLVLHPHTRNTARIRALS